MDFILYEELGAGSRSVVHKGRRKGCLNYVAIICTDKSKRPEITNHVRLSHGVDHQNVVRFHEWYETSNHLWLVMELCTGGSLESVINQDGCLPEDVVKTFGWDLVQGLKHIHESGIILSDLTPAKILLDGSGILKFGNFCLSKAEGETLEGFFTLLSKSEEVGDGEEKEKFEVRKRLQGSPTYSAPEVLQGSETSVKSDLWALGCILFYMYTGKPPFYSDDYTELKEKILHQEPPRPGQRVSSACPPSEHFQNLLTGLLNKNPNMRMGWPELLDHPFWNKVLTDEDHVDEEETEGEESDQEEDLTVSCEGVAPASSRDPRMPCSSGQADEFPSCNSAISQPGQRFSKEELSSQTSTDRPSLTERESPQAARQTTRGCLSRNQGFDNGSEFRPRSGVDEDNTEAVFLLSSCAISRRSCSTSETPNQIHVLKASADTDITSCVKALLYTDSDLTVTPIIGNPKVLKSLPVRFDPKTLCVPAYSVEKLLSLNDEQWRVFIFQLCTSLEDQRPSSPQPFSTAHPPSSTVIRSGLNVLCYLCCVAGHKVVANKLINSTLLPLLTQQLRKAPNWDVRSKVLRVMGLLALHCTELDEDCPVSEAVTTLTDQLRDNLRNSKAKQFLLPSLGEFLHLIASQEEKRGSPEGLWFVPAAAYTCLMRSLREGNDSIVQHMAAKAIENIATTVSSASHPSVSTDMGSALWHLFTHSTVEAVRVTAISALTRIARVVPGVFLAVMDTSAFPVILAGVGGAADRVQQHLLTGVATALVTSSHMQTHKVTQIKDLVLNVLRCLDSKSTVTRAKALLLLLLLIKDDTQKLLYCCQHRFVMYLERDLRKAISLTEKPNQSRHLSQCLDLGIVYLRRTASLILEEVLHSIRCVIGRKHPSSSQSKQLKYTLPTLSVVLELLSSQVFRSHIVSEGFLGRIGLLLHYITSIESNETNFTNAVGAVVTEFIRTALSMVEVLSQHPALIIPRYSTVVDVILPSLTKLAFSVNVERSLFVLRVLSELSLVLLVHDGGSDEDENELEKDKSAIADEQDEGSSLSPILDLITKSLLPRYESLLSAAEPIPLYALKLLVSMTEHSMQACRLIKHSGILPAVFQLIESNSGNVASGMVQNAVDLLCNLSDDSVLDLEPTHQQGLVEILVITLSKAAAAQLDGESGQLLLQALLELLHNILKQTSAVVRSALQSQRLSCPAVETEAAEKLLLANRPLSQLSTHLIQMLSTENQEVWEESLQCLFILVQLYGGEGLDCLSPSSLQNLSQVLSSHMQTETPRIQRTTLRIIKRLVQTTDKSDWSDCPEGKKLETLLQDITTSNRYSAEVVSLADEILHEISRC